MMNEEKEDDVWAWLVSIFLSRELKYSIDIP
jgi:hypothetical protein